MITGFQDSKIQDSKILLLLLVLGSWLLVLDLLHSFNCFFYDANGC